MKIVKLVMQPTLSSSSSSPQANIPMSSDDNLNETSSSLQRVLNIKEADDRDDNISASSHVLSPTLSNSSFEESPDDQSNIDLVQQHQERQKFNQERRELQREMIQTMLKQESTAYKSYDYFYTMQPKMIYIHDKEVGGNGCVNAVNAGETGKDDPYCSKSLSSVTTTTTDSSSLSPPNSPSLSAMPATSSPRSVSTNSDSAPTKRRRYADVACRDKICEWTYRLINFFNINRQAVYIAMSYLDRFLMTYKVDRYTYKILATTSLLLALKVHQPRTLILKNVIKDLSKGEFDMDDVDHMELVILKTLSWSLHPPTPIEFVSRLIEYQMPLITVLNNSLSVGRATSSEPSPDAVTELNDETAERLFYDADRVKAYATFFVELSVFDYFFVTQKPSLVALAAILNTIEGLGLFQKISSSTSATSQSRQLFYRIVLSTFELVQINADTTMGNGDDGGISRVRSKLWGLYETSEEGINAKKSHPESSMQLFCRRGGDRREVTDNDGFFASQNDDRKSTKFLAPRSLSYMGTANNNLNTY
mmetsp:Transcript_22913/g.28886  ORF Transcript_22913/g.28886 Transcript_22913/m.28886 type:complete len:535 (+) Transcript_22913:318-1922(+)|eukprot:CAMPEP_0203709990 /NCGR_PEP_ID=MMETSP0091-20130426/63541_1 /ASSEMBLY_ACC=CAM_ASM_001089 /TAXON_ID=426623 /ORGANISM="Chaetoceros affinis, Strain CCMP159" /LENGTH=534 /DNA_ID=CAMNT_0050587239 /DNA_START=59 /DNA_END=1663 /DNA_ORIENTATION=+